MRASARRWASCLHGKLSILLAVIVLQRAVLPPLLQVALPAGRVLCAAEQGLPVPDAAWIQSKCVSCGKLRKSLQDGRGRHEDPPTIPSASAAGCASAPVRRNAVRFRYGFGTGKQEPNPKDKQADGGIQRRNNHEEDQIFALRCSLVADGAQPWRPAAAQGTRTRWRHERQRG